MSSLIYPSNYSIVEVLMKPHERHELQMLIREVVVEAVPSTVSTTLERFGFTVEDVPSMQQDMAHLRRLRKGSEAVKSVAVKTCFGALISGGIWLLIEGFRVWLKNKTGG